MKNLFSDIDLEIKINGAIEILRRAEDKEAILSFSGGIDSVVLNDMIKRNSINIKGIFYNESVENQHNVKIIREVIKTYSEQYKARTKSYKDIVLKYGFPIQNKNFSEMCYRVRKVDKKNYNDVYRIITGISPNDIEKGKEVNVSGIFRLDLKYWHFATNYPIQTMCCNILKKQPSKKIKKPMIIGIMKTDSMQRRRAILENNEIEKFYPLEDFTKDEVILYCDKYNVEISKSYKDRVVNDNCTIVASKNTGCVGCHYGNSQNHYYRDGDNTLHKTTKFENLKRENARIYNNTMNMKHSSGVSFKEVLDIYYRSIANEFKAESIVARDRYIQVVKECLVQDKMTKALAYLDDYLKKEVV